MTKEIVEWINLCLDCSINLAVIAFIFGVVYKFFTCWVFKNNKKEA